MIRQCKRENIQTILDIVNQAAQSYRGKIPEDHWNEQYMPAQELEEEIKSGVKFYGLEKQGRLIGVMGIQEVGQATLIRHAYVLPEKQSQGVGGELLKYLKGQAKTQNVLVGTWEANTGAVNFYEKHGFKSLSKTESEKLLRRYWSIPESQLKASIVLELKHPPDKKRI